MYHLNQKTLATPKSVFYYYTSKIYIYFVFMDNQFSECNSWMEIYVHIINDDHPSFSTNYRYSVTSNIEGGLT